MTVLLTINLSTIDKQNSGIDYGLRECRGACLFATIKDMKIYVKVAHT